ncbi:uncharacterized protein BJ171DRAFT_500091 [Polychytrium aggregatum]|uniref:uncharacterized protein n=1 Tax=Polychytrium aggregatum TaxID=110093 RepID=UPI0022FEA84B|nr:uncharacterized protein BJ171DRAFT_500091 [Polychytrium aggregatum]KAI9205903.1 hypothetical protein BJ171DRAFT_500091 [Polychytrium aggregatum]
MQTVTARAFCLGSITPPSRSPDRSPRSFYVYSLPTPLHPDSPPSLPATSSSLFVDIHYLDSVLSFDPQDIINAIPVTWKPYTDYCFVNNADGHCYLSWPTVKEVARMINHRLLSEFVSSFESIEELKCGSANEFLDRLDGLQRSSMPFQEETVFMKILPVEGANFHSSSNIPADAPTDGVSTPQLGSPPRSRPRSPQPSSARKRSFHHDNTPASSPESADKPHLNGISEDTSARFNKKKRLSINTSSLTTEKPFGSAPLIGSRPWSDDPASQAKSQAGARGHYGYPHHSGSGYRHESPENKPPKGNAQGPSEDAKASEGSQRPFTTPKQPYGGSGQAVPMSMLPPTMSRFGPNRSSSSNPSSNQLSSPRNTEFPSRELPLPLSPFPGNSLKSGFPPLPSPSTAYPIPSFTSHGYHPNNPSGGYGESRSQNANNSRSSDHNQAQGEPSSAHPTTASGEPSSKSLSNKAAFLSYFDVMYDQMEEASHLTMTLSRQIRKSTALLQTLQSSGQMIEGLVRSHFREMQLQYGEKFGAALTDLNRRIMALEENVLGIQPGAAASNGHVPSNGAQHGGFKGLPSASVQGASAATTKGTLFEQLSVEATMRSLLERIEKLEKRE